jgi:hypothetical protein
MASRITEIFGSYKRSLEDSYNDYKRLYKERSDNARGFYEEFLKNLIRTYRDKIETETGRRYLKSQAENFFGTNDIPFAAIDGTLHKEEMSDFLIFFGGSYAARGQLSLRGEPPTIKYEKWSTEQDTSMVAYVPIPFAELSDIAENTFFYSTDYDRINLSNIHSQIMQLAEIYLAYDLARSSVIRPKILLLDHSLSSLFASSDVLHLVRNQKLGLIGYRHRRLRLRGKDAFIAYSYPYNLGLGIPTDKGYHGEFYILSQLTKAKEQEIDLSDSNIDEGQHIVRLQKIGILSTDSTKSEVKLLKDESIQDSWEFVKDVFEHICQKLFRDKNPSALTYEKQDEDGNLRKFWMTPDDLKFLVAVGLRALVETCWKYNILLIGIAKDSSARYFSKNYLGVLRHCGFERYGFPDMTLLWSDRALLELLPYFDDELSAPWSTVEFDSTFMTLRLVLDKDTRQAQIAGVRGEIITPERLFLKSLAQFYLDRSKGDPLCGHVIFVDRLTYPEFDRQNISKQTIKTSRDDKINPVVYPSKESKNQGQDMMMYLLNVLTRNLYPEVIGYCIDNLICNDEIYGLYCLS